jgi:6-phosphogluconolactonase (cycloisomerase 2 family)
LEQNPPEVGTSGAGQFPIQQFRQSQEDRIMNVANFSRRFVYATALAALALLTFSLAAVPSAYAQLNLVYAESSSSTGKGNGIIGFSNDGTGHLTKLPRAPYATAGTGPTGAAGAIQFDSDGEMIANSTGSLMFAVNGHSNTISVFTINTDGSLTRLPGAPVASGGQDPVSLALKENVLPNNISILVALNKASDPGQTGGIPNYTTFDVNTNGVMTLNPGSTFNLSGGTSPAQVIARPGPFVQVFGIEFLNNKIVSYHVDNAGLLTELSELVTVGPTMGGTVVLKSRGVYVGLPTNNEVEIASYTLPGILTQKNVITNNGSQIGWLTANAAGTRLYTSETGSGTVSVYDLTKPASPTQLQQFSLAAGSQPAHLKLDTTGNFLYVVDRTSNTLHVLNVSAVDGSLTETLTPVSLGLPAGAVPQGLVTVSK